MTIFTVSDSSGLYDALENAAGGDTILLAAGDYGDLVLDSKSGFDITFDSAVTITSADPGAPASFSGMTLNGAENLTFDNVTFDYTYDSTDEIWQAPFSVRNSQDITISNSLFDGDVASGRSVIEDGYGFAKGLVVLGSTGVSIENNEFTTWHRGMTVSESQDIVVSGNEIHSIRSDGMNFSEVQSVRIEDNYIYDFKASLDSLDHRDMIQFWTNGTDAPSTDIIIRNNVLDIGEGDYTQSIFMRNDMVDRGLAGSELFYKNVLIEENVILNAHGHGITVGETDGLTIRNNSVLSIDTTDDRFSGSPTISVAETSTSVTIQQNAVGAINGYGTQADWVVNNNAYIQNTDFNAPGYYADLFLESSTSGPEGAGGYIVAPGSMIDNLNAGSSQLSLDTTPAIVTPNFDVTSSADTAQALVFDATPTYGPAGQVLGENATFAWDFGDGTTGAGRIVEHSYATPGNYDVTLTVVLDGQHASTATTAQAVVGITGDDIIAFNASDGAFYLQGYGDATVIDDSDTASVATTQGMALDLGGAGTKVAIAKEDMARFFGSDEFEMSMTLQADQPGVSWGEVARVHNNIIVSVREDGNLSVRLFPDSGENIELISSGVAVNDGSARDISIQFDGASDSLQIVIDGQVAGSQTVTGSMPVMQSWGLVFGEPWGGQNFDGKLSAFELEAPASDYPVFEGVLESAPEDPRVPVDETPRGDNPDTGNGQDEGALPRPDDSQSDFVTDFAELRQNQLRDDANVGVTEDGSAVYLDGEQDYVRVGKLAQFESSEQLSFSVTYSKGAPSADEQRLVWNNKNVGLSVEGDSLKVFVGQAGERFQKAISIDDLGLDDAGVYQVSVMVDAASDRLQVVLDDVLVLDQQQGLDISFDDGIDRSWNVGGVGKNFLDGELYDFRIDASADFLPESALVSDDASLMG